MADQMLPFERTSAESREAALKQMRKGGKVQSDRSRIYEAIRSKGSVGMTDQEIEAHTGIIANTVRPRRGDLAVMDLIVKSGERRKTSTGCTATVWVVAP